MPLPIYSITVSPVLSKLQITSSNYSNSSINMSDNILLHVGLEALPNVTLVSPENGHYHDTSDAVNITFTCNATDTEGLANISLYITNSSNESFSLNQTTNITETSNSTSRSVDAENKTSLIFK